MVLQAIDMERIHGELTRDPDRPIRTLSYEEREKENERHQLNYELYDLGLGIGNPHADEHITNWTTSHPSSELQVVNNGNK